MADDNDKLAKFVERDLPGFEIVPPEKDGAERAATAFVSDAGVRTEPDAASLPLSALQARFLGSHADSAAAEYDALEPEAKPRAGTANRKGKARVTKMVRVREKTASRDSTKGPGTKAAIIGADGVEIVQG